MSSPERTHASFAEGFLERCACEGAEDRLGQDEVAVAERGEDRVELGAPASGLEAPVSFDVLVTDPDDRSPGCVRVLDGTADDLDCLDVPVAG
jgi:hypothetical protein